MGAIQYRSIVEIAEVLQDMERYFTEAEGRFSAASRIKPDQPEILVNWGNLLLDRAKSGTRRDASELFLQAEQKYRSALAINSALPGIHYGLGNLLLDRATTLTGADSDAPFGAAEEQYGAAITSDPNMAEAFYQWGNVYLDRAKRNEGAQADRLFESGMVKFMATGHSGSCSSRATPRCGPVTRMATSSSGRWWHWPTTCGPAAMRACSTRCCPTTLMLRCTTTGPTAGRLPWKPRPTCGFAHKLCGFAVSVASLSWAGRSRLGAFPRK